MANRLATIRQDLVAGLVVFLVALPLCLGVAHASNAPLMSGVLAGIIGGVVVGILSGSRVSVSGPAAGLTAVVAAQITAAGSYERFLVAVAMAGLIQLVFAALRAGGFARFFPNCVINGLLAAIGIVLILKQVPHLFGHDIDDEGEMSFLQPDQKNSLTELIETTFDIDIGAATVGLSCLALMIVWGKVRVLKKSVVPAPLVVVIFGSLLATLFRGNWIIGPEHMVRLPDAEGWARVSSLFLFPDFSGLGSKAVYAAAATIAIVASLETLLNLEAVDKIDPDRRTSPPNRELFAQGVGNLLSGLLGGIPVTSVIVRSSVNIYAGGQSRVATVFHGLLLITCVVLMPTVLNRIPLAALAAILIVTGYKLAKPAVFKSFWRQGWNQFLPFIITILAIVFTDLLVGILIGLGVSLAFILFNNLKRPLNRIVERHIGGDVLHLQLPNQVSFLNRAMIAKTLEDIAEGTQVLLDARDTDYIDADILQLIREFECEVAPTRGIRVSMVGFKNHYDQVEDRILFADYTSREIRNALTPERTLQILKDGNERFLHGTRLSRDLNRQLNATATGQFPLAAVLSCIDSRAPTELIFDVGLGDLLTVRIAGNVAREKVLGSLEYAAVVAGVKLIVVMGHTRCGAVTAAVNSALEEQCTEDLCRCENLEVLLSEIRRAIRPGVLLDQSGSHEEFVDKVAEENVRQTISTIFLHSKCIRDLAESGAIQVVGCMYDVKSGRATFDPRLTRDSSGSPGFRREPGLLE
ncbi:MAG: sulfate transporter [Gemmataceae bacterium]|nr:sulfate transporter [Gemmataceae bacterium]